MNKFGGRITTSIVMPCLDEERFIGRAVASLLEGAGDGVELLVVDGGSTDKTRDIVRGFAAEGFPIRLLDNPKGRVSAAMNIGIREARGEWIVRADAHCLYPPGYVRRCVELLKTTGAANAGGRQVPVAEKSGAEGSEMTPCLDPGVRDEDGTGHGATGDEAKRAQEPAGVKKSPGEDNVSKDGMGTGGGVRSRIQLTVVLAMRHPVGTGDARWRLGRRSGFVDTVYLGAFRRSLFDEIGFYDEEADANQDAELNMRILAAGKKIYLDHKLEVPYFPRESLRGLTRQYFRYGRGRARTALKHRRLTSWRQAAAPLLLVGLAGSTVAAIWMPVFLAIPAAYAATLAGAALFSRFAEPTRRDTGVFRINDGSDAGTGYGSGDDCAVRVETVNRSEIGGKGKNTGESSTQKERKFKVKGESIGLRTRLLVAAAWAVMHVSWGAGFLGRLVFKRRRTAPANEVVRRCDRGTNGKEHNRKRRRNKV